MIWRGAQFMILLETNLAGQASTITTWLLVKKAKSSNLDTDATTVFYLRSKFCRSRGNYRRTSMKWKSIIVVIKILKWGHKWWRDIDGQHLFHLSANYACRWTSEIRNRMEGVVGHKNGAPENDDRLIHPCHEWKPKTSNADATWTWSITSRDRILSATVWSSGRLDMVFLC